MPQDRSVIRATETSVQDSSPIELYRFVHGEDRYDNNGKQIEYVNEFCFTSDANNIIVKWDNGEKKDFVADTIQRENIIPGTSGSVSDCNVLVDRDNPIAALFKGAPPERSVRCYIYRLHADNISFDKIDTVVQGVVSQVSFKDSECTITVALDPWLQKEIPNGMTQFYCNWSLFDKNCTLDKNSYEVEIMVDRVDGLVITSSDVASYEDGYFTGGRLYYQGNVRMIKEHYGNTIVLKYPTPNPPRNKVRIVPGCDQLFSTCATRYRNSINFSGVPYTPPTDAEKNPTGTGTYWIDDLVIQRDTDGFVGTIEGIGV